MEYLVKYLPLREMNLDLLLGGAWAQSSSVAP